MLWKRSDLGTIEADHDFEMFIKDIEDLIRDSQNKIIDSNNNKLELCWGQPHNYSQASSR